MQVDLFGNPIGSSHPVVDILGQEHKSVAKMIEFWNKEYESISPLESPPFLTKGQSCCNRLRHVSDG